MLTSAIWHCFHHFGPLIDVQILRLLGVVGRNNSLLLLKMSLYSLPCLQEVDGMTIGIQASPDNLHLVKQVLNFDLMAQWVIGENWLRNVFQNELRVVLTLNTSP